MYALMKKCALIRKVRLTTRVYGIVTLVIAGTLLSSEHTCETEKNIFNGKLPYIALILYTYTQLDQKCKFLLLLKCTLFMRAMSNIPLMSTLLYTKVNILQLILGHVMS